MVYGDLKRTPSLFERTNSVSINPTDNEFRVELGFTKFPSRFQLLLNGSSGLSVYHLPLTTNTHYLASNVLCPFLNRCSRHIRGSKKWWSWSESVDTRQMFRVEISDRGHLEKNRSGRGVPGGQEFRGPREI